MIDYHLLEALVTYAQVGTLAKTAQQLGVTQPAISHTMRHLEEQLGVQLFIRTPNKLYLSETGKYAAREAKKLLNSNLNFTQRVQQFNQNQATLTIAANAPGPLIVLRALKAPNVKIWPDFLTTDAAAMLADGQVTCVLLNHPLDTFDTTSVFLGTENMSVNLPADSPLAHYPTLHFKDLNDQTLMSPQGIGFWHRIYQEQMPDAKFIYQDRSQVYSEILNYSSLPFFTTNLTNPADDWGMGLPQDRIVKPLTDKLAHQQFYAVFLTRHQERLHPLIERLQDQWDRLDATATYSPDTPSSS